MLALNLMIGVIYLAHATSVTEIIQDKAEGVDVAQTLPPAEHDDHHHHHQVPDEHQDHVSDDSYNSHDDDASSSDARRRLEGLLGFRNYIQFLILLCICMPFCLVGMYCYGCTSIIKACCGGSKSDPEQKRLQHEVPVVFV